MKESDLSLEIKHSLQFQFPRSHYKKMPDQIFNPNSRFNPEKEYDGYLVHRGCFSALEFKLHKNKNAFSLDEITPLQKAALTEVQESGGNAYVVIGVRYESIRKTYFIKIQEWLAYIAQAQRKSIPLVDLEKYLQAEWLGKGRWALKEEWFIYGPIQSPRSQGPSLPI